jgi:hypothetical protein
MSLRKSNWPALLALFIEEKKAEPFVWGQNDCCLFVADWVCILTGYLPLSEIRGTYANAREAIDLAESLGGVDGLWNDIATKQGWKLCPVSLAQRGDIAAMDSARHGPSVGVVIGANVLVAGRDGAQQMPLNECTKAWRIG